MMKRVKKLLTVVALSFSMLATSISIQNIIGMQETANAATIKLNKNNIILKTGASTKLKVVGTKKKVKWSTDNKFVATVDKNGKVRGQNAGEAYIYAKAQGKNLKCKVTVKNSFDEKKAKKNIKKTIYEKKGYIFVFLKSNYEFPTSVTAHCYFYDSNDKPIDTGYSYLFWLEKGREGLLSFQCPDDYCSYEIKYDFFQSFAYTGNESVIDKTDIDSNRVSDKYSDKIFVTVKNNSDKKVSYNILIKYYDENGNLIYARDENIYDVKPKDKEVEDVYSMIDDYAAYTVEISTATYYK